VIFDKKLKGRRLYYMVKKYKESKKFEKGKKKRPKKIIIRGVVLEDGKTGEKKKIRKHGPIFFEENQARKKK
jgi:hypothetical protein